MIQYNENPENKKNKIIKHRCKIKSTYYYIQIYTNMSIQNKKITFSIKSSTNNTHFTLYKRVFYYNELLLYNKYFNYFSSFESIFTNIEQSIIEKKFNITENIKCLSLTMKIYIEKLKKYSNITINLNSHTKINQNLSKSNKKKVHKLKLGIQNNAELNHAIHDIRKRLKIIERSQSQIMMSNYNINNTNINNITNSNPNEQIKNNYIPTNNIKDYYNNNENSRINDKSNYFLDNNNNNINYKNNINYPNEIRINENNMNKDNSNINNNFNDRSIDNYNKYINIGTKKDKKGENSNDISINNNNDINIIKRIDKQNYNNNMNNNSRIINDYSKGDDFNKKNAIQNSNFINTTNINNSNMNKIDSSEININNNDILNVINESNLDSKKMVEINNLLMKKLENLENAINNKDIKIKKLESKVNNLNTSSNISRRNIQFKMKNKSIENYNNNNNISSISPIQNSKDLDYSNSISIINKKNSKNISQEQEKNNNPRNQINKFTYNNIQKTDINDNSGYPYSEIENNKNIKINKSIDNYNKKESSDNQFYDNKDNNNNNNNYTNINIYDNNESNIRIKEIKKSTPLVMAKGFKSNSVEKSLVDKDYKKHHHHHHHHHSQDKKRDSKVKDKLIKKNISVEKSINNYNDSSNNMENNFTNKKGRNKDIDYFKKSININTYKENTSKKYINYNKNDSSSNINNTNLFKTGNDDKNSDDSLKNNNNKIFICKKEDIKKYVNSKIIFRKDELRLLKDKISNNDRKLHVFFDLLYRASKDGEKEIVIKDSIEGYFETLTLFYTYEGARFGVYLKKEEIPSFLKGHYYREVPGSCFIVGLNNLLIFPIEKKKTCNANCNEVLCFGRTYYLNKNGTNWIIYTPPNKFLKQKCIIGNGIGLFRNINIEKLVGDTQYHIKEVEIFNVAIERFYRE